MTHYTCPHCQRASFSFLSKWLSSPTFPSVCRLCSGMSCAPCSRGGLVMVVNALVLTASGFAASYWQTGWAFLPGVVFAVGFWFLRLHFQPMLVLTPIQKARARKVGLVNVLLVLAASAMQ